MSARYQVGDRVHYTYRAFHKNLFGTVLDVVHPDYQDFRYKVKFDTYQGSSLEGMWLMESHLERVTPVEELAACADT